jgi:predicted TIM-barrel fold metal-dependent hydrolase
VVRTPVRPAATVARVRLPIIDADGHVMEPFDLWDERLPEEYRDRAWRRVKTPDGEQVSFLGRTTGFEWTVGSLCTPGALSANGRLDRDLDTEVDLGISDPARRLELMDEQGVAVSVLFPTMTLGLDDIPDADFRAADARAYNSWIADFCGHDPIRLRYAAVLPLVDVRWALAEIERAVDDGATTVMLSPIPMPDGRDLGSVDLDPVWDALVDAGLPAVVHASNPASPALGMRHLWRNRGQWQMGVPFQLQLAVLHVIDGRVLERHPDLHVGFFEGDVGWLPHWLGRLDETYHKMALVAPPPARSALEQFRAQCVISGESADLGFGAAVDLVGAERVLWASDWPHQDGAWPDPILLLRDRDDLTDAQKRACLVHGAAQFFGIDLDHVLMHLGDGWSLDADLDAIPGMLPTTTPAVR